MSEAPQIPVSNAIETPSSNFLNVRLYSDHLPILLRNPEEKDATIVHEITGDPAIYDQQWLARRASISEAGALDRILKMRGYATMNPPARIELVIVLLSAPGAQEEGTVIGLSGIRDFSERPGKVIAEVGASIISTQRNKGYYAEALRLSIDFALDQSPANAIQIMVHEDSSAKIEILKDVFGWKRGVIDGQGKFRRYDADKAKWAETREYITKNGKGAGGGSSFGKKLGKLFGKN